MGDASKDDGCSQNKAVHKRALFSRRWTLNDVLKTSGHLSVHMLAVIAPFNYKWEALRFGLILLVVSNLCITFSYHRNLTHRSFKLPKWLEYLSAYTALFALQGHPIDWVSIHRFHHQFTDTDRDLHSPIEGFWFSYVFWIFDTNYMREKVGGKRNNVMDLENQWFYRFLRDTMWIHIATFWALVYYWGGVPYLTCGVGVAGVIGFHIHWSVASICHIWGSRQWNTTDTSHNVWWLGLITLGEGWHNNHHAFEASARIGLEWYQVDICWYLIRFFQTLGLATDVKLPSEAQKRKMAFAL